MKKPYSVKSFEEIRKQSRGNLKAAAKQWEIEVAKFVQSLADYSRDELIALLCEYLLECSDKNAILKEKEEVIALNTKTIEMFDKGTGDVRKFIKRTAKYAKATNKRIEYLENIRAQKKLEKQQKRQKFETVRNQANEKRKEHSRNLQEKLKKAVKDYYAAHPGRKVPNKEVEEYLSKRGFVGERTYTESTLKRNIALIAAKIKRESSVQ